MCLVNFPGMALRPLQEPLTRHHMLRHCRHCRLLYARVSSCQSSVGKIWRGLCGTSSSLLFFADLDDVGKCHTASYHCQHRLWMTFGI